MLLPFGRDKLVVFPNPLLLFEFWAYGALCTNIVDAKDDVSKINTIMDTVKTHGDIFLAKCTFCSNKLIDYTVF